MILSPSGTQFACSKMLAHFFKMHCPHLFAPLKIILACLIYCSTGIESVGIVCCVGERNDVSGQGICSIPSHLSRIDDVLQKSTACFGACLKQPSCTTYTYDFNNCTLGYTALYDCIEYLVSRTNIHFQSVGLCCTDDNSYLTTPIVMLVGC